MKRLKDRACLIYMKRLGRGSSVTSAAATDRCNPSPCSLIAGPRAGRLSVDAVASKQGGHKVMPDGNWPALGELIWSEAFQLA